MANRPYYITETQVLRRVANDPKCRWRFTKHSLIEMANDGWTANDVMHVLMTNGQVIFHELKHDLLWRVEGTDIDGGRIRVVVAVYEKTIEIKVITTF